MWSKKNSSQRLLDQNVNQPRANLKKKSILISFGNFLILIGLLMVTIWVFLPDLFSLPSAKNLLFFSKNNDGSINKLYLAFFDTDRQQIWVREVQPTFEVPWVAAGQLQLKPLKELTAAQSQTLATAITDPVLVGWWLGVDLDQIISLPAGQDLATVADLKKILFSWPTGSLEYLQNKWWPQFLLYLFCQRVDQFGMTKLGQRSELPATNFDQGSVAVINTTQVAGLATQLGDWLTRIGYRVIRIDNRAPELENSVVVSQLSAAHNLATQAKLAAFLGVPVEAGNLSPAAQQVLGRYRAQTVILIGQDLSQRWQSPQP